MNVILLAPLPPPSGGMASWTLKYMESSEAGINRILVVNTAVTGRRTSAYYSRSPFNELKRFCRIQTDLKRHVRAENSPVVHLNCACGRFGSLIKDYLLASAAKRGGAGLVTQFHCDLPAMMKGRTDAFFLKKIVRISDRVLTLNQTSEQFLWDLCSRKSTTVPNFLTDELIAKIAENQIKTPKASASHRESFDVGKVKRILFVGRVEEEKGCGIIYETARRFPQIHFQLLGFVTDEFRRRPKPNNVELTGEVEHGRVIDEMLKADLLMFPTRTEGFPYAALEAMACGLPVLAAAVGAIPDMIEESGGILIPPDDADAAAEAILALGDKNLRERMGCWNREKVRNCYTAGTVMNQLFQIYEGVLKRSSV
ncbi:MAG: glycosyltransferase [Bacillota bacterium]|nr:glycosyltransferase [Bacillota bacterium]